MKLKICILIISLLGTFICMSLNSVGQYKAYFHIENNQKSPVKKGNPLLPDSFEFSSTTLLHQSIEQQYQAFLALGYLAMSIDSISKESDSIFHIYIHLGKVYKWAKINLDSVPLLALNKTGIRKIDWSGKQIQPTQLAELHKKIIHYYENNGYPFASIIHDNTTIDGESVATNIKVNPGSELKIDTIIVKGNVDIAPSFLQNYLNIKQGGPYQEAEIKSIAHKIKELNFLQEEQPWEMYQTIAKNELHLFLKKKKSNQINGLIGLQPNNNETGKMLLTVDALLDLKNSFGYGERIMASYQNLQKGSPKLIMGVQAPYILGLPIAIEGNFYLYKRDTLYTKVNFDIGAKYLINAKDYLKLAYLNTSYRVNYVDFAYIQREKKLPNIIDTRSNGVGLQLFLDHTDYTLAPRKGWIININTQLFNRTIKENLQISTFEDGSGYNYGKLYDTISLNSNQYKIFAHLDYYLPLYKTIITRVGYAGGWMQGENLYLNELYQIGGFQILRGFDEESIFSNQYHIFSIEPRFLINAYSYFYAFSDFGWLQSNYNGLSKQNKPFSIGAGLSLQNESGVFKIAIGVGKNQEEPLRLRQAKLHFGYTALF